MFNDSLFTLRVAGISRHLAEAKLISHSDAEARMLIGDLEVKGFSTEASVTLLVLVAHAADEVEPSTGISSKTARETCKQEHITHF